MTPICRRFVAAFATFAAGAAVLATPATAEAQPRARTNARVKRDSLTKTFSGRAVRVERILNKIVKTKGAERLSAKDVKAQLKGSVQSPTTLSARNPAASGAKAYLDVAHGSVYASTNLLHLKQGSAVIVSFKAAKGKKYLVECGFQHSGDYTVEVDKLYPAANRGEDLGAHRVRGTYNLATVHEQVRKSETVEIWYRFKAPKEIKSGGCRVSPRR